MRLPSKTINGVHKNRAETTGLKYVEQRSVALRDERLHTISDSGFSLINDQCIPRILFIFALS